MNDFPKELFLKPRTAKILAVGRADKEICVYSIIHGSSPCNIKFVCFEDDFRVCKSDSTYVRSPCKIEYLFMGETSFLGLRDRPRTRGYLCVE